MTDLVTGAAGQDGQLLIAALSKAEKNVVAVVRTEEQGLKLQSFAPHARIEIGDISNPSFIEHLFSEWQPSRIFNLAAMSSVSASWTHPKDAFLVNTSSVLTMLEQMRVANERGKSIRLYQASSAEMFSRSNNRTITEQSELAPDSPYAISKAAAHSLALSYREAFDLDVRLGILFNHESPLRGENFVVKKITSGVAQIARGEIAKFSLGNLGVSRDWGYAPDFTRAIQLIMDCEVPGDYVVGTGLTTKLEDVLTFAFRAIGVDDWTPYIEVDETFIRPLDHGPLVADSTKIKQELGWLPTRSFEQVVAEMVELAILENKSNQVLMSWLSSSV